MESDWSDWYPLIKDSLRYIPDQPGVYEIRTNYEFGRLKGKTNLVYVGRTDRGNSLKERLKGRIDKRKDILTKAEWFLLDNGHPLEFRFTVTKSKDEAKLMEAERLAEYDQQWWELPPGNSNLPKQPKMLL